MKSKKKLVFVINYFYPDLASTGQLMTDLCLALQNEYEVIVIAAQPGYTGEKTRASKIFEVDYVENIKVIRIKLPKVDKTSQISRIRYIFSYFLFANIALLKEKKMDIIYTISQPPILGGMIGTIGKFLRRSKHVYNIQDFNPEQAEAIAYTNKQFIFKAAKVIDKINCRYADHIIIVGSDMADTLQKRFDYKNVPSFSVVNNWTNEKEIIPLEKTEEHIQAFLEHYDLEGKFIIMYSGNIGLYYDLENIITVCQEFKDNTEIVFLFIGEGAMKKTLQTFVEKHKLLNVKFLPYQSKEFIKYSLNAADVHFVVNQKGIKGVSVPSKIYGVMAAGKPILGVLEQGSEAQILIEKSHSGLVVEPQNYQGIVETIHTLFNMDKEERKALGINGRRYLEEHLRKETSIQKYKNILKELLNY